MPLYQDEGVVLRTAKLGEADRILTLLTRDHGKVRAVAKGVRRTKSRFGGRLEPFMRVALLIAEGRSLDVVSPSRIDRRVCRADLRRFSSVYGANVICETADRLCATEKEPAVAQYRLVLGALTRLPNMRTSRPRLAIRTCCAHWRSLVGHPVCASAWCAASRFRLRCPGIFRFPPAADVRRRPYPRIGSGVVGCDLPAFGACRWRLGGSWTVFRRPRRFNGKPTK